MVPRKRGSRDGQGDCLRAAKTGELSQLLRITQNETERSRARLDGVNRYPNLQKNLLRGNQIRLLWQECWLESIQDPEQPNFYWLSRVILYLVFSASKTSVVANPKVSRLILSETSIENKTLGVSMRPKVKSL